MKTHTNKITSICTIRCKRMHTKGRGGDIVGECLIEGENFEEEVDWEGTVEDIK